MKTNPHCKKKKKKKIEREREREREREKYCSEARSKDKLIQPQLSKKKRGKN